jgi:uncharacterized membrane protein
MVPEHSNSEQTHHAHNGHSSHLANVVVRNINALLQTRQQVERKRTLEERIADTVTKFTGSMIFVYLHLIGFALWIIINLGWLPIKKFDPSFVVLAMFASVEAIFLSTFVLISQNRMMKAADERADLDLHVSLLAEHEITRILTIVDAMAHQMGIDIERQPDMDELKKDVPPEIVLQAMEEHGREHEENGKARGKETNQVNVPA